MAYRVTKVFTRPSRDVYFFDGYTADNQALVSTFKADGRLLASSQEFSQDMLRLTTHHTWSSEAAHDEFRAQPAAAAVFAARDSHNAANGITCTITTTTV
jgi:quinol monooxygenase YgiN